MTGTNRALNAARQNGKQPRQLLRKERLADGDPFLHLTAHANGRPVYDPFKIWSNPVWHIALALCCAGDGVCADIGREASQFFQAHCLDCHDNDVQKGGLNLAALDAGMSTDIAMDRWTRIFDRVRLGDMPPAKRPRPVRVEVAGLLDWIKPRLIAADRSRREVVQRRLNREEYQNTLHDLLGIQVELKKYLPADQQAGGFDNNGAALALSTELMQRYLDTARMALDAVIVHGPRPEVRRFSASAMREVEGYLKSGQYGLDDGRIVIYLTDHGQYSKVSTRSARLPEAGRYRFRFTAATQRSAEPMVFSVVASDFANVGAIYETLGFYEAGPKPRQFEIEAVLDRKFAIQFFAHGLPTWIAKPAQGNHPGIGFSDVEIEGPLNDQWPPAGHRELLGDVDLSKGGVADAERILRRFMPRAFRRPVDDVEVGRYRKLVKDGLDGGRPFEASLRVALEAVLCSPNFIYLREDVREGGNRISAFELAARLSCFLWSSAPDEPLLRAAAAGRLHEREALRGQVERMLGDPKAERLVRNFVGQWLRLREIDATTPDRKLYGDFDELLKVSMVDEGEGFFRELLKHDLSVVNFLQSDFAMLNGRLAENYGIEDVAGLALRRVALPRDSVRGGVLTQGGVLKVTANGTATSPVTRGVWVLENILGMTVPPPPPGIAGIEPDIRGAETIREQLDKHRQVESCNACHQTIDPPGFALESFDPIGRHREHYLRFFVNPEHADKGWGRVGNGAPVDSSGVLASGERFPDIRRFRELLLERKDGFVRCLVDKLLTYALGREMGFADRDEIERIAKRTAENGSGLRTMICLIVESELFAKR